MLPIRRVLHPTDFSERSQAAFRLACGVARDHNAPLLVLHVIPPAVVYGEGIVAVPTPGYTEEMRAKLHEVLSHEPNVVLEHKLVEGDPAAEILRVAREAVCDLIVLGTHGWTGLRRLLMGSVAEEVVRKAHCPVLTVKTPFPAGGEEAVRPAAEEVAHV